MPESMLVSREELRFDLGGARFDLERDRSLLTWIFSQSLFGEATGCYCGAALYTAPDIESATFLSRQALEEFAHFHNFLRIFRILGTRPRPPHPVMRFLTTHEKLWDHHVCLEMAVGEGLVLIAFDMLIEAFDQPDIKAILQAIADQECGHVRFGEQQTLKLLRERPRLRRQLLGRALISLAAMRLLGRHVQRWTPPGHPVMSRAPEFLEHAVRVTEMRLRRLGLLDRPLSELGRLERAGLMALGPAAAFFRGLVTSRKPRIPRNYLQDPVIDRVLGAGRPTPGEPAA